MDIKQIGVVGMGLMGSGIVESCARAGFEVIGREVNDELLERGMNSIKASMERGVKKGKLSQADMDAALARVKGVTSLADFTSCDLVIEAAVENMALKKTIFTELDMITRPEAILASNTSSLSITEIASATGRPDKVVGLHFFNPVPVMPLLEAVSGLLTSQETLEVARWMGERLNKQVIYAKDNPGFIVNLLLVPYLFDAVRALENGVASKEDIDTGIKLGLNHPMGPFTLMDFVGLDTCLFIGDAMYQEFKDARYAAPPLLRRMVTAGLLGRKSGRGFYSY
ncbi:MAG TPA: 3-hydroxybutyryl-CoA dehydrogenase [Anaerolineae bacterium]|nr:3-hydroxybutyryl-CoA dehydrogenase [Anaerolineae bacterium]